MRCAGGKDTHCAPAFSRLARACIGLTQLWRNRRKGHALRASLFPVGEGVHRLNPIMAKRFGPPGNAWARQIRLSRSRSFELGTRHAHRARKDRLKKERHYNAASHACMRHCDACPFHRVSAIPCNPHERSYFDPSGLTGIVGVCNPLNSPVSEFPDGFTGV
jgi:hypothetical protein